MDRRRRLAPITALAACLAASGLAGGGCRRPTPPPEGSRLVLLVVVDQMRYDYLERFAPLFSGGLARLLADGVSFDDAWHDHALTTTSPGHATLATGLNPSRHGIVGNGWWDLERREWRYSVEDDRHDRSPQALSASTLGDWMQAAYPRSKVFAASGKDRAAILLGGRGADAAFWYDRDEGGFTSSSYYRRGEPGWLARFNDPPPADRFFGTSWEALPAAAAAAGPELGVEVLDRGLFPDPFPHPLGRFSTVPDEAFYDALYDTPVVDELLGSFARALIENEGLGQDPYPDFLGLSFSALDSVGHDWGPNSPEVLDTLLRLDRVLGELLDFVDQRLGVDRVVIALSSDHGVVSVPEYQALHGLPGRRVDAAAVRCVQTAGREVAELAGGAGWPIRYGVWDEAALEAAGLEVEAADAALRRAVEACPGVARLWTRRELASGEASRDPVGALFAHSFHPDRSPGLAVQLEEHFLAYRPTGTTHGSPYGYDRHVPWLLVWPGGAGGRIAAPVRTVDVAPTLAALAGIPVPEGLDGADRSALLEAAADLPGR